MFRKFIRHVSGLKPHVSRVVKCTLHLMRIQYVCIIQHKYTYRKLMHLGARWISRNLLVYLPAIESEVCDFTHNGFSIIQTVGFSI
jgi:hypothetical protein